MRDLIMPTPEKFSSQKYSWIALGGGSYNRVWKSNLNTPTNLVPEESYNGKWVLKYAVPTQSLYLKAMSDKTRSVRVWNEINSPTLPKAGLYKEGWVAPFIENDVPASDDEIASKLIEIYCETKRIIVDAATDGNFIINKDTGETVLVDVDLALKRSTSPASINFSKILEEQFESYWEDPALKQHRSKTIAVTRNLLFLENNLSVETIDQLHKNDQITIKNILALTWLRENKKPITQSLFNRIALFNDSEIALTAELLEALSTGTPSLATAMPLTFFSTENTQAPRGNISPSSEENSALLPTSFSPK